MQATSICITDLTPVQISKLVATMGEPDYRAAQLRHWIYRELALSFDDMTDLPKPFRSRLTRETRLRSIDDATVLLKPFPLLPMASILSRH